MGSNKKANQNAYSYGCSQDIIDIPSNRYMYNMFGSVFETSPIFSELMQTILLIIMININVEICRFLCYRNFCIRSGFGICSFPDPPFCKGQAMPDYTQTDCYNLVS